MKKLLCLLLSFALLFTGCTKEATVDNEQFDTYTNQLFIRQMNSDALSANYTLSHPENWGVTQDDISLGTVTLEGLKASLADNENQLHILSKFEDTDLTFKQQVLYDTLKLSFSHALNEKDFLLFEQYLGPTTGVQAQLPVLLCEFHLNKKEDFNTYFALLKSIPMYFQSIIDYEKQKIAAGNACSSSTLSRIILQCRNFVKEPKKNLLITHFNQRLKEITYLSNDEKKEFKATNKQIITEFVLPAYNSLITSLEELSPSARTDGGLAGLKNGKAYYAHLFQSSVGSLRSISDAKKMLTNALTAAQNTLLDIAKKNPDLFQRTALLSTATNTPKDILANLETKIQTDFPATNKTNYQVRYVPDSLEDSLSPAFFLTPPMDNSTENVIYINGSTKYENTNLFPTLAHEGYPGHLYQSAYLYEHLASPLQSTMNFGGYTEGWATYAELYSYRYAGLEPQLVTILQNESIVSLCLYTLCDIGIHYEGWDLTRTGNFLEQYGVKDISAVLSIYQNLIDEPASYPKYTMGYLEILALKEKAKELLGEKYTDKIFHTYILEMGPTWFEVLNSHMETWLEENIH